MARGVKNMPNLPGILSEHPSRGRASDFRRIASKIAIDPTSGCWIWQGAKQSNGYGRSWDGEKSCYAHRFLYEIFLGPITEGMDIDHICRNRLCVNPLHLEPVTRSENLRRGDAGENIAQPLRDKTHCPKGHPYSGNNLRTHKGRRHCRACARQRYDNTKGISNG